MRTFLLMLLRFVLAFGRSWRDPEFRAIFIAAISLLASGTIFYATVEGWSVVDALYFSIITLTTTGYGDLHPTTPTAKVFTIVYLLLGVGIFVAFARKLGNEVLKRRSRQRRKRRRTDRQAGW